MKMSWRCIFGMTVTMIATRCLVVWIEVCRNWSIKKIHPPQQGKNTKPHLWTDRKLAIVVPIHEGDKGRALKSLQKWPSKCHPLTVQNVDLILYKAESVTNEAELLAPVVKGPAKCFRLTSVVSANLLPEVFLGYFPCLKYIIVRSSNCGTNNACSVMLRAVPMI